MSNNNGMIFIFKLFNSIKSPHEANVLAKLEIRGLFGDDPIPINNFSDILSEYPINIFTINTIRFQDMLMHELPYGKIHGYLIRCKRLTNITHLVQRLGYTREIFLIVKGEDPKKTLDIIFPENALWKNAYYWQVNNFILFRFITHQYFLEKSEYISKLSRNEEEIERNVNILLRHLNSNLYRIPASSTMKVGKRLEDYFAIREEPSLYLNHYMHPYKGKFHPKMIRSLLNYILPQKNGTVLDNFAGSGTLLLEASYMGINSIGVEINPLSALMCNVKCHSTKIPIEQLKREIEKYLSRVHVELQKFKQVVDGQQLLSTPVKDPKEVKDEAQKILTKLKKMNITTYNENSVCEIIIARELLRDIEDKTVHDFLLLCLSGSVSDVGRRTKDYFENVLRARAHDLYLRLYLFHTLNKYLKIKIGQSTTHCADTRNMKRIIKEEDIDGIINSPPYSTALDYIRNDYPQLILLNLVNNIDDLEENMIGNPRKNYDKKLLLLRIASEEKLSKISPLAWKYVNMLLSSGRTHAGLRIYKFYIDMIASLDEMNRVMKRGGKCVIIIGNNHFVVDNRPIEIPNDDIVLEIAKNRGFTEDIIIKRDLEKSSTGNIREESILIFQKT